MSKVLGSRSPAGRRRWARALVGASTVSSLVVSAVAGLSAAPAAASPGASRTTSPTTSATTAVSGASAATTTGATVTNLLTGADATFDGTVGNWVGSNATLSWAQTPSILSGGSLEMTASATTWVSAETQQVAAIPGALYTGQASLYSASSSPVGVGLAFYDSSGTLNNVVWDRTVTPAASTWTSIPETAAIAPSIPTTVALIVVAYNNVSIGQNLYIDSPVLGAVSGNVAPPVIGPLHTSGNRIVQATGAPVTLHGMNMAGLEYNGTLAGSGLTQQDVTEAKAWGANFVRLPISEAFWLSSNCKYSPSYASSVSTAVNWITSLGMVALLDLHTNTLSGCQSPEQHNMADQAQSPVFWSQVARTFASNPLVAFDLYNEPHDISSAVWLKGGPTKDTATGITYNAAGMQQLYNSVRSSGAQNLVFVGGLGWAATPPTQLVKGSNVVYADHVYTGQASTVVSANMSLWTPLSATEPVVVTEFGNQSDPGQGTYNAAVIAFVRQQGWGWSAWAFVGGGGWFDVAAFLTDGTAEPIRVGIPVLLGLSGVG